MIKLFLLFALLGGDTQVVEYTLTKYKTYEECNKAYIQIRDTIRETYGRNVTGVCVAPRHMQDFLKDLYELRQGPNSKQKEAHQWQEQDRLVEAF